MILTLANGAGGKIIHLHGDGKVLKVVEKLEEGSKLIKGDSLKRHKTHVLSSKVTEKRDEISFHEHTGFKKHPNYKHLSSTNISLHCPVSFVVALSCNKWTSLLPNGIT